MKRFLIFLTIAWPLVYGVAHAQTAARVYSCPTAAAAGTRADNHTSCPSWAWATPPRRDADLPLVGVCTTCNWNPNNVTWKRPRDVTAAERIAVCTGTGSGDGCSPQSFVASTILPAPSNPPPTVTVSANPMSVPWAGTSIITWSSTNATACEATGIWGGNLNPAAGGSQPVPNLRATATYGVRCTGAGGSAERSLEIVVGPPPPPPEMTLSIAPGAILVGETAVATWGSGNVASCSSSWAPSVDPAGQQTFGPYSEPGLHEISVTCTGLNPAYPSAMRAVVLTVRTPPSIVPVCLPDEEDVWPRYLGGRGKVAWKKLDNPLGKLDYKATYFCPDGAGGTVQVYYATDSIEVVKSVATGARYDKAAARARCETECITLPDGPTNDEVRAWAAAHTVDELGVVGE